MSGKEDTGACAIRVMLADDHRATLCGMAVMVDAPFAADWIARMDAGARVRPVQRSNRSARTTQPIAPAAPVKAATSVHASAQAESVARVGAVWHPAAEHITWTPAARRAPSRAAASRCDEHDEVLAFDRTSADIQANDDGLQAYASVGAIGCMVGDVMVSRDKARVGEAATMAAGSGSGSGSASRTHASRDTVLTGVHTRSADLFDALDTTPCDVLVCDLAMGEGPHGDGLTMIGHLRRQYPHLKLIVHTMCGHACVLRNLQLLRVHGILSKMDDLALLSRAITTVHNGGTVYGPSVSSTLEQAGYKHADTSRPAIWSKREAEVIRRFVNGDPVKEIAQALNRSVKTVSTQKMSAMHKAGINSNAELYQYAAANGLLTMPGIPTAAAWQWCEVAAGD